MVEQSACHSFGLGGFPMQHPLSVKNYEFIGDGQGVHWPDIDEDISAEGMLMGTPAQPAKQRV